MKEICTRLNDVWELDYRDKFMYYDECKFYIYILNA